MHIKCGLKIKIAALPKKFRSTPNCTKLIIIVKYCDDLHINNDLQFRVGNNMLDLVEVAKVEMVEPSGWINVDLDSGKDDSVRAFMLQVHPDCCYIL